MASNDYALNLVGDISKYQAELAKVPGFTQRTAASAAVKMAAEMSKGQEHAAQNAIRAAERAAAAQMAASEKVAAQQVRDAQEVAAARARLETVAASGSQIESQVLAYKRQKAEIEALGKTTGDTALQTQALAALNKNFAAGLPGTSKSLDGVTKSARGMSGGLSAVAMQMPDVVSQLSSGAPVMQVLTQQGLQVTQQMMGAAGGLGGFASALSAAAPLMAAAAVAVAALAAGYAVVTNHLEAAAEAEGRYGMTLAQTTAARMAAAKANADLAGSYAGVQKATDDQIADLLVLTGGMDQWEGQERRAVAANEERYHKQIAASGQLLATIRAEQAATAKALVTTRIGSDTYRDLTAEQDRLSEAAARVTTQMDGQQRSLAQANQAAADAAEYAREQAAAEEFLRKRQEAADKARAQAAEAAAARQARDSALRDQMIDRIRAEQNANTALTEVLAGMGDQPDKIEQEYQARIALISALDGQIEAQRLLDAMGEAEYARDLERYEVTRLNLEESTRYAVEAQGEIQRAIDQTIAKQAQQRQALLSGTADLSTAVMGATQFMLDQQVAATGKASKKLYRLNQAAALATIIARTAEGIVTAASLPPPVDAIKFAAVGIANATALAQLATAKPPAFDIGGTVGSGPRGGGIGAQTPDQVVIRALPGERVQSREEVAQRQAGPQIQVVAMPVYQHFGLFARDAVRQPGSLRTAIRQGRPTYAGGY